MKKIVLLLLFTLSAASLFGVDAWDRSHEWVFLPNLNCSREERQALRKADDEVRVRCKYVIESRGLQRGAPGCPDALQEYWKAHKAFNDKYFACISKQDQRRI